LLEEALVLSREAGYGPETAISVANLGITAMDRGDYERAEAWLEEAEPLVQELGERQLNLHLVSSLGAVAVYRGKHERAKVLLEEVLKASWEFGAKPITVECLASTAELSAAQGEDRRAAVLWGAAQARREVIEGSLEPDDLGEFEELSTVPARLGEAAWEEALAEGRAMTLEEAVSYALEEEEAGG
jgi:ATP/maltotriose-dependent transcriptional regulator MalT